MYLVLWKLDFFAVKKNYFHAPSVSCRSWIFQIFFLFQLYLPFWRSVVWNVCKFSYLDFVSCKKKNKKKHEKVHTKFTQNNDPKEKQEKRPNTCMVLNITNQHWLNWIIKIGIHNKWKRRLSVNAKSVSFLFVWVFLFLFSFVLQTKTYECK